MKLVSRWGLDAFLVLLAVGEAAVILLSAADARWLAAALAAVSALILIARHRHALAASIVSLVAIGACLYLLREAPTVVFFALMASFAIVAAINSARDAVIAWLVGAALIAVGVWSSSSSDPLADLLLTLALCTVLWTAGLLVSRRTRQATVMAMRLEVTELERERAVQDERGRIARELHDVVSHGLTVVVVQTLAARSAVADLPPAQAAEADRHMAAVEAAAREALADMRRMLGLLQSVGDEAEVLPPAPRLADLALLCDRAREAGVDVDDSGVDATLQLPQAREMSVYRIVQEALTNAIKHAPGSHVRVRVARDGDAVDVEVVNDAPALVGVPAHAVAEGGGRGLLGMRERVATYGGSVEAGPAASGGFAVHAILPLVEREGS
jgi:signal transduction histidine kinase